MDSTKICRTFDAHREAVYRWAFRVLGSHDDALDVTQEVFLKWWRAHRDQSPPARPTGWLRSVTLHHSINLRQSRRDREALDGHEPSDTGAAGDACAEARETHDAVARAIAAMSDHQRAVLVAKLYDGCTFAEVATQMSLALPTVKTHYLRALRTARRVLTEAGVTAGGPS